MRNESQKTTISIIRDHVNEWRKGEGWSRETVAQVIVEKFEEMGGPEATGIHFEPKTRDAFERTKVNADRIFRWLDDVSKDGNLMPANFGFYILAAMPTSIRMSCVNDLHSPLGLEVHGTTESTGVLNATSHLVAIAKEGSEAQAAIADLIDGATQEELAKADRELAEVEEAIRAARSSIRNHMTIKVVA